MFRLTREVRLAVNVDGSVPDGKNGHAGRPALSGLGHFFVLRLTVAGDLDPASSYLRNIKDLDDLARTHALPLLRDAVASRELRQDFVHQAARRLRASAKDFNLVALELAQSPFLSTSWNQETPEMVRLSQRFEFSAAHRLHNPSLDAEANVRTFGKCNNPNGHGHNYELQVTLVGTPDATGTLLPVAEFERLVDRHVIQHFDHRHLNLELPEFRELNPSVENIAMVIHRRLRDPLSLGHAKLLEVTVWETPKTWATYQE